MVEDDRDWDAIDFLVETQADGSLVARAFGLCIVATAPEREALLAELRDAVCCHFDDGCAPRRIRLRFIRVEREEVLVL